MYVFLSFQFKTLICMCEMCCSGVKCSAVPSRRKTTTHPLLSGRVGRLWGEGRRIGEQKKKVMKEGERVTYAPVHRIDIHIVHFNMSSNMNTFRSFQYCPLFHSVVCFFSFFLFLLLFFVAFLSVHYR